MTQLRPGQVVRFRTDLSEDEWQKFRDQCGLIGGRKGTLAILEKTGRYIGPTSVSFAHRITCDDGSTWWIPTWVIIADPIDKMQAIKDKIKYLDNRYVTRHCKEPVPQVSTDW